MWLAHIYAANILLAVGLVIALEGPAFLAALSLQGAATWLLGRSEGDRVLRVAGATASGLAGLLALSGIVQALGGLASWGGHLAHGFVIAQLIALAWKTWSKRAPEGSEDPPGRSLGVACTWTVTLAWLTSVLLEFPQEQVLISGAWAIAGVVALVAGISRADRLFSTVGFATLGIVLAKLLTVDLAAVDTFWRVGLFFVIGLGLLRLGYIVPRIIDEADRRHERLTPAQPSASQA